MLCGGARTAAPCVVPASGGSCRRRRAAVPLLPLRAGGLVCHCGELRCHCGALLRVAGVGDACATDLAAWEKSAEWRVSCCLSCPCLPPVLVAETCAVVWHRSVCRAGSGGWPVLGRPSRVRGWLPQDSVSSASIVELEGPLQCRSFWGRGAAASIAAGVVCPPGPGGLGAGFGAGSRYGVHAVRGGSVFVKPRYCRGNVVT